MNNEINNLFEFGEFRLDAEKFLLWRKDDLISLSPKALELLCLLVKRHGEIVSKEEIFETVWAETFVEEGVLTQNIYTLRQTLGKSENGKQLIENVARRGYRLTIPVNSLQKINGEIPAIRSNSREYVLATQTHAEIIEEFIARDSPKLLSGKIPFYKRKSTIFFSFGLIILLLVGFFSYRLFRQRFRAFFHPPLENVHFLKLTDTGNVSSSAISPDGNFMAFVQKRSIFLKDINSGKDIKLEIPNIQAFHSLKFSPDGNYLLFRNVGTSYQTANILQVSRFGGETKIIAEKSWLTFGISKDGKILALIRNFPEEKTQALIIKNLENGDEREILRRNYPETFFNRGNLAFSADGKKISFIANAGAERSTKLFTVDVETGSETEIKVNKLRRFEQAVWLPDGESLIVSASEIGLNFQLWKIFLPNGDVQRITNGFNSYNRLSISADGKNLLTIRTEENSNIWMANANDLNNQIQITQGNDKSFGQTSLDWIDDEKIVFAAAEEKNPMSNLWIINANDKSRQPLTSNTDFHSDYAKPSADGKFIYFNTNRGRLINIWRINSNGENLTEIISGNDGLRLFPNNSPDGKFLYFLFRNRDSSVIKKLNLADKKEENLLERKDLTPAAFVSLSPDGKYIAFLNLVNEITPEFDENNYQIGIVSIENPADVKFFNIKTLRTFVRFSSELNSFDYVSFAPNESKILRQYFDGEIKEILTLPNERIFNFTWSKDGKKLAISRGNQFQDAILLTEFE